MQNRFFKFVFLGAKKNSVFNKIENIWLAGWSAVESGSVFAKWELPWFPRLLLYRIAEKIRFENQWIIVAVMAEIFHCIKNFLFIEFSH